jgi:hypothetical protein
MPKANTKAWFTSPIAHITFKKVDAWAEYNRKFRPFFPTWKEAHDWMLTKATERLKQAERELKRAQRSIQKIKEMKEPSHD